MTNQVKIMLGAFAFSGMLSFGTISTAQAQTAKKTVATQQNSRPTPYQRNQDLIKKITSTKSNQEVYDFLLEFKNNCREEIANSKRQVLKEKENGTDESAASALKQTEQLSAVYNKVVAASRSVDKIDRETLNTALEAYQKLH